MHVYVGLGIIDGNENLYELVKLIFINKFSCDNLSIYVFFLILVLNT
jgi:hypothetical protein